MANRCPFCGNYAYTQSVGDAYQMDCRYCDIQVEITKRAYAARCPDPVAVLDYIGEKMKGSTRPRVDIADMKRTRQQPAPAPGEEMNSPKQSNAPKESDSDVLTTAAKAIGATLAKIAVKTGIAKAPDPPPVRKKAAVKRKAAAVKGTVKKSSAPAKRTQAAPKRKQAK